VEIGQLPRALRSGQGGGAHLLNWLLKIKEKLGKKIQEKKVKNKVG